MAEWGDGIFGIEAAARHYYGKQASQLSTMEAARLASVLPNPIRFVATSDQKYVTFRANLIHNIMVRRGIAIDDFQEVMETKDDPGLDNTDKGAGAEASKGADSSGDKAATAGAEPPVNTPGANASGASAAGPSSQGQASPGQKGQGQPTHDAAAPASERLGGRVPAQGQPAAEPGPERLGGRVAATPHSADKP